MNEDCVRAHESKRKVSARNEDINEKIRRKSKSMAGAAMIEGCKQQDGVNIIDSHYKTLDKARRSVVALHNRTMWVLLSQTHSLTHKYNRHDASNEINRSSMKKYAHKRRDSPKYKFIYGH